MAYLTYLVVALGSLAALLLALEAGWKAETASMAVVLFGSLLYMALKSESARQQLEELRRLRAAYDQLDQQAKLIIRTDLELHRTQEELDRRLASLMSLHELGRQLQVNLRPEEVFGKLDAAVVTNFGFSKGLLGMCGSLERLEWRSLVGVTQELADGMRAHLLGSGLLRELLTNPVPHILQPTSDLGLDRRKLLDLFGVPVAVVAGVMPHTGPAGFLLLGRAEGGLPNPKADEELVAILTNQLAIAVENSALYEETWASQRELERKVQERTRELAEANAGLIRLNKAKSDFVSAVSHELRTPLAAVKGYAALLGSGQFGPLSSAQSERITKIEKHADLLTQLINNLLDIARIESGRVTMESRLIPLEEFVGGVKDMVGPQLDAKHLRYSVELDGVKHLAGDPQHLQRVFVNLLSNAVKYTPERGVVALTFTRQGGTILASVRDTGCGISAEDLPKLFHEFYRANDALNQQIRGTGLGLALVKRIVEAHHGTIEVESAPGKGSTFTVSLPADAPAQAGGAA